MQTLEYSTIEKADWPRGPWDMEPDKIQWRDEATNMACLIVRGPVGALCGYVGVEPGHPWHGLDYSAIDPSPDVHGGLTFSGACQHSDDPAVGICHVPAPGEADTVWWLGFDCAHARDLLPNTKPPAFLSKNFISIYRDREYVAAHCRRLAAAAKAALARSEPEILNPETRRPPIPGPLIVTAHGRGLILQPDGAYRFQQIHAGLTLGWMPLDGDQGALLMLRDAACEIQGFATTLSRPGIQGLIADLQSIDSQLGELG